MSAKNGNTVYVLGNNRETTVQVSPIVVFIKIVSQMYTVLSV